MRSLPIHYTGVAGMALALALAAPLALAQPTGQQPRWEFGAFGLGASQQAYPGSASQTDRTLALPYFVYRGEVLRADRDSAGLRAIKTPDFEVDVGVSGSFGSRSDQIEARQGMPKLGTLVEFGPRIRWKFGQDAVGGNWRLELPLRGVFDLSDGAAHRGMAFEPRLAYQRRASGSWFYSTYIGAVVADQRLAQNFYGVAPQYALADRPTYQAQGGLVAWRLGVSAAYAINRDWRVFGFARMDSVSGAANETSPLVKKTHGASLGMALSYTWLRSERGASD